MFIIKYKTMKKLLFLPLMFITCMCFTQISGKLIGEQVWTTSNLNVTKFQNGDPIYEAKTNAQWINASEEKKPAWCYLQNNVQNGVIYGKLYNWYAVNDPRGLAPKGWHIPSLSEWVELETFLGKNLVNAALKSTVGWKQYEVGGVHGSNCEYCEGTGKLWSNTTYRYNVCVFCGGSGGDKRYVQKRILSGNGTNKSGFSAKPGVNRFDDGNFNEALGEFALWWFDNETNSNESKAKAIYIANDSYNNGLAINSNSRGVGASVRLVQDNPKIIEKQKLAKKEKLEKERLDKEAEIEKERLVKEAEIKKESLAKEAEIEKERLDKVAKESKIEKERLDKEAFINKIKESSANIIDEIVAIENLIVAKKEFPEKMNWRDAKIACAILGDGWRLPTRDEMNTLFLYKHKISRIDGYTWSSTGGAGYTGIAQETFAWCQFVSGENSKMEVTSTHYVRAVKTTLDSSNVTGIPCPGTPNIQDIDGNTYNTVKIGTQCWTRENLRVSKYNDGTTIPLFSSGVAGESALGKTWWSKKIGARTIYDHSQTNLLTYGYLYNWYAVENSRGLCPTGWGVPTDDEWAILISELGGEKEAHLKMFSNDLWEEIFKTPDIRVNFSRFSALPGGRTDFSHDFAKIEKEANFWSATENTKISAWTYLLNGPGGSLYRADVNKLYGYSVRCLRD
jgi:uncharacterized protein (TIGR02145 family)